MNGYANAYAGYLTTPEEYDEQAYEGGSTLFGRSTLGAVRSAVHRIARAVSADLHAPMSSEPPATAASWLEREAHRRAG